MKSSGSPGTQTRLRQIRPMERNKGAICGGNLLEMRALHCSCPGAGPGKDEQ